MWGFWQHSAPQKLRMYRSGKRDARDLGPIIVGDNSSCLEQKEVKEA